MSNTDFLATSGPYSVNNPKTTHYALKILGAYALIKNKYGITVARSVTSSSLLAFLRLTTADEHTAEVIRAHSLAILYQFECLVN